MATTILSLHTYPVKACAGLDHTNIGLSRSGLHRDRQWVIVDGNGAFITQRTHPALALIRPSFSGNDLLLDAPGMSAITVPWLTDTSEPPPVPVRIWKADTLGFDEGNAVAQWLSQFMKQGCRLLRVHPQAERVASAEHVNAWRSKHKAIAAAFPAEHRFGFADGYPFLIASQDSLNELNAQLQTKGLEPVPMNRFRPNIVLSGMDAYEEDYMAGMRVGPMVFAFVKRCKRCQVPNIDQATAIISDEPGITLARHRQFAEGVLFGVNAVMAGASPGSRLHAGNTVELELDA